MTSPTRWEARIRIYQENNSQHAQNRSNFCFRAHSIQMVSELHHLSETNGLMSHSAIKQIQRWPHLSWRHVDSWDEFNLIFLVSISSGTEPIRFWFQLGFMVHNPTQTKSRLLHQSFSDATSWKRLFKRHSWWDCHFPLYIMYLSASESIANEVITSPTLKPPIRGAYLCTCGVTAVFCATLISYISLVELEMPISRLFPL